MFRTSKCPSSGKLVRAVLWYYNTIVYLMITMSVDVYRSFLVISGFRPELDENYSLLGYYAASSCHFYRRCRTTYLSHKIKKKPEDGIHRLPRNVRKIYHNSLHNNPEECSYLFVSRFSWNENLISACVTACRWTRSDAIDSNSFPHILCLQ